MKRENILISENYTTKRVSATKFTAPGNVPAFDCLIHFGKEGNDVTLQNCIIQDNALVKCSPEDTYDFETGALISLMKMCGSDKVVRACNEAFSYEKDIEVLRKDNNNLRKANKGMQEEIKRLKGESENRWKKYQRNIQKKQDRINELERAYKASNDDKAKLVEYYQREIKKLEAENEKLKLDCEMLQHGYNDTDLIFCGGRQNAKQHKLLVDLFKKIPKDKVQAAYVVAYKESLIWRTSQPSIRDSLDKLNEPISKLTVDSLIEQSRAFTRKCVNEWLYKPPTKREEMWEKIFTIHKESDVIIKVKKEDVNTFLHELENKIPEITWVSGLKIFETKYTIKDIYFELKTCDTIYFRLWKVNKLSYSGDSHIYPYRELKCIDYLPPMRWDLFKKGRIAVRLTKDNYKEFYDICEKELGRSPSYKPDEFAYAPMEKYILKYNKKFKGYTFLGSTESDKIVNWEDVR